MANRNWSPVNSDRFHLSYHKHFYLCHFILEFSITRKHFIYYRQKAFLNNAETVANDRPINIYIYTNTVTLRHSMSLQKGVQNNVSRFSSFDYKISMLKNAMYAHVELYTDSCHSRCSRINKIYILNSSYCCSKATAV